MPWRCRASHVVDLVDFEPQRMNHVVPDQFKVWQAQQMRDVRLLTCKKVVDANNVVPLPDELLTKVRTQKSSAASYENSFQSTHRFCTPAIACFSALLGQERATSKHRIATPHYGRKDAK